MHLTLNGDGIRTTALGETEGTFDLLNTGNAIRSGWISASDAFLAVDRNGNGKIDDRSELFGGAIGEGFAQLESFDSNGDGVVNNQDAGFGELLLWQDKNSNHGTDAGELKSLKAAGIGSLNTGYQAIPQMQNGNLLLERSLATWTDGRTMEMVDVYFRVDQQPVEQIGANVSSLNKSASITIKSEARVEPIKVMGQQGPFFVTSGVVTLTSLHTIYGHPLFCNPDF
jgi:serine-aspartate repeat-containing protein C/D/E